MSVYQKYYQDKRCKNLQFLTYGYSPPTNYALELEGGLTAPVCDFRTVERYREYKEAGFNALLMQTSGTFLGEEWETSAAKMVMDRCHEAGVEKVIVLDERLRQLSQIEGGLVGQGKRFSSVVELEDYVADCMQPYKDHPAFYGVQLRDEPNHRMFEAIGQVYKAVKKVSGKAFVQCNLLPLICINAMHDIYPNPDDGDVFERYEAYLSGFLEATGADYIMYDNYPFQADKGNGTVFYRFYFRALQIAAKVCREHNVSFYYVLQSCEYRSNGIPDHRLPTEAEMFYQVNALLGYGVRQFAYFTYWTKAANYMYGEAYPDGGAMMTRAGEKTPLYGYVKKVNAMAQRLAPVLLNFVYVDDKYLLKTPIRTHAFHTEYTLRGKLPNVLEAETSGEIALVNAMYDKERNQYLYRIQNITYNYYEQQFGLPKQKTTLRFTSEFSKVDVFDGESWHTEELKDGKYGVELSAGYAVYIMPY